MQIYYRLDLIKDSGQKFTRFIPIVQNTIISDSVFESDLAGRFLTQDLKNRINLKYQHLFLDNYIPKILKEKFVCVAQDYKNLEKKVIYQNQFMSRFIELPDKNKICLNEEIFEVAESMFSPDLFGFDHSPLPVILAKALKVFS